jgi:hypothetical protein
VLVQRPPNQRIQLEPAARLRIELEGI